MAEISLREVTKEYEAGTLAVKGLTLQIADGEFIALVGPSGCGKSTTLRMIAGLEEVTSGEIRIGEKIVNGILPRDRDIAMVFQNYALYPHKTVFDNIAFGLKIRKFRKNDIARRVHEAAEILGISNLLKRKPKALSGGQRQRVAMGRAIVRNPEVFLFDEPLSNLDAKLRVHMRTEIKKLHQKLSTTTIYVTHDQVEAMTLADRVVVMNGGLIEQLGQPQELYSKPATRFVAGFIGSPAMNFIPARVIEQEGYLILALLDGNMFPVPADRCARYAPYLGKDVLLGLRPEHLSKFDGSEGKNVVRLDVLVDVTEPMGMETMAYFTLGAVSDLCARVHPTAHAEANAVLSLAADLNHLHLIDPKTEKVI